MRIKNALLLLATVFVFTIAFGQSKTGTIAGYVKDASSKIPLIEAVVTVSSPVLQGKKFAVTDSSGLYKIPDLPSGIYTVSFEMEGFKTFTQENVNLIEGMSLGVSFEMAKDRNPETDKKRKRLLVSN